MKITDIFLETQLDTTYRALLVSDMHSKIPEDFWKKVTAIAPDLILIAGDFVDGQMAMHPDMLSLLKDFCALAPTYYATGNHELFTDADRRAVKKTGVVLLENDTADFHGIRIGGLKSGFGHIPHFTKTPAPDLDYLERFSALDGYKILIAHHPEYFKDYIRTKSIDLTVSGHAHGGQWRLGSLAAYAPGQGIFPRYTSGLYRENGCHLIVSRGVGNHTFIPRIFNPTELVVITLQGKE